MSVSWLEITLDSHHDDDSERLEEALTEAGALAITFTAADESEIFEPSLGEMPLWPTTGVTGLFPQNSDPETVIATLNARLNGEYALKHNVFADSEWTRAWLDYFQPINFGQGFWVAATEHVIEEPDTTILRLDPGLAFGTGTHPSTAMCLDYLNHQVLDGLSVYDYGCGSGILGIAAALLGAKIVYQTDIDPQALIASADNAKKNKVSDIITIVSDPEKAPTVDLIVANILLSPLCDLKPRLLAHLKPQGKMIFAGILDHQVDTLKRHYIDDCHVNIINQQEHWVLLLITPKL